MRDIRLAVSAAEEEVVRDALSRLLHGATSPAFGTLTKRELELLLLEAAIAVGFLDQEPTVYAMVRGLRITRSRARSLMYDRELRRQSADSLDVLARRVLSRPLLQNQTYAVALDIENPLLSDHLRDTLRRLGHTSDGSFSPNLIRLTDEAAAALIEYFIPAKDLERVKEALFKAGVKDKSLKGALKAMLRKAASKVASDTGEAIADDLGDFLGSLMKGQVGPLKDVVKAYLAKPADKQASVAG